MKQSELIPVGYWYSKHHPDLPMPTESDTYDPEVASYLKAGEVKYSWRGFSSCRLCNEALHVSRCLTDGVYIWPEGLPHYLEEHGTPLPEEFLDHIIKSRQHG